MTKSFIGMDMLAEPELYPPAFVREWERRLTPPRTAFVTAMNEALREAWRDSTRLSAALWERSEFVIPIRYGTPPEQQARYELRQAQRKLRGS